MKLLAAILLLTFSLPILAEPTSLSTLPAAPSPTAQPKPHAVFSFVDYSLAASVIASHIGDYVSTQDCISHPTCKEDILPSALVHNRPCFLAYELGTASLEILGQYELERMGHSRIARVLQAVNVGLTFKTDVHNYQLASVPVSTRGLTPSHPGAR